MRSNRRQFLATVTGTLAVATAGCTDSGSPSPTDSPSDTDIVVGPDGRLVFEPDRLEISTGTTVTWYFASGGHNVSCRPAHSSTVSLPDSASPFSSYEPNDSMRSTEPAGTTFSHTLTAAGAYVYVCIPHVTAGMTGRLIVEG